MGEAAVIVEGVQSADCPAALFSTVHGAGRVMSRTAAKKTIPQDEMTAWVEGAGVELRGAGLDEAPQAYKRLPEVLAHHAASIRILHNLRPIGVAMAGPFERDPFRD